MPQTVLITGFVQSDTNSKQNGSHAGFVMLLDAALSMEESVMSWQRFILQKVRPQKVTWLQCLKLARQVSESSPPLEGSSQ